MRGGMMKKRLIALITPAFVLSLLTVAHAVPNLISYQGVLNDKNGAPISATVNITFRLYSSASGGTALWTETQSVQVSNGIFNVKLGNVNSLHPDMFQMETLFLGLQAASDPEMSPRQQITSSAYALYAHRAGSVTHSTLPIGAVTGWIKAYNELRSAKVTGREINKLIDSSASFSSELAGKSVYIAMPSGSGDTTINLSDESSKGYLISKGVMKVRRDSSTGWFRLTFFYSDGTNSVVQKESQNISGWIDYHLDNPYLTKLVWKMETKNIHPHLISLGASSVIVSPQQKTGTSITRVDSPTQLSLADDLILSSNISYKIYQSPGLPAGWVELNGQKIIDTESPYNNFTTPDLTSSSPLPGVTWIMKSK